MMIFMISTMYNNNYFTILVKTLLVSLKGSNTMFATVQWVNKILAL